MNFLNNRFDFLRINEGQTGSASIFEFEGNSIKENEHYFLPYGENCVSGSTCYYVDKGDLFIYYKPKYAEQGGWYLQKEIEGSEVYASYAEGDNPYYYYSSGNDGPVM